MLKYLERNENSKYLKIFEIFITFNGMKMTWKSVSLKKNLPIFCPKYHCELNPIEGLWCDLKQYISSHWPKIWNNEKFIIESREKFLEKTFYKYLKLFKRFWRVLRAYKDGKSYGLVLKTYFSGKSKEQIEQHIKLTNYI